MCALYCNTVAITNTAVGACALRLNTTGGQNTALGFRALATNVTGISNTAVGYAAQCTVNASLVNTIAIGCGANTSANNNHTVWGNSGHTCHCIWGTWTNVSDARDKTNIKNLPDNLGLKFIKKLRPVTFNWDFRDRYVKECGYEYGKKDGTLISEREQYGLVAQEVRSILDEMNVKFDSLGYTEEHDGYRIAYTDLIPSLIKAVQELETKVAVIEEKLG
jgi:hypothetical protein